METQYKIYDFTPQIGWSISRYEVFDKCKRMYYYNYYGKFAAAVPSYKMRSLKELTSVPLEMGNIVHDVIEAFLRRLQKSDSNIDESRFFEYAMEKTSEYFYKKTFIEKYYHQVDDIDMAKVNAKIRKCLENFLSSPVFNWIFMKALRNKDNWMIEPGGYGETRLNGLKAYCKMDFLFPVDGDVYILDWKTGRKNELKHAHQLIGYTAAASTNFHIPVERIFPKIVYLYPEFEEFELRCGSKDLENLFNMALKQTREMESFCENHDENFPKPVDCFPVNPSESLCRLCNFQELCFPDIHNSAKKTCF